MYQHVNFNNKSSVKFITMQKASHNFDRCRFQVDPLHPPLTHYLLMNYSAII